MLNRVLIVGIDANLLTVRQSLFVSRSYDSQIATPSEIDEKLQLGGSTLSFFR